MKFDLSRGKPEHKPVVEAVRATCHSGDGRWYPPLLTDAPSLGERILERRFAEEAAALLDKLSPDDYARFLSGFYREGLARFGAAWRYADIVTVLLGLSEFLEPAKYLEIGVRRGRSACAVASRRPDAELFLFDIWRDNYAGMANPGPELVQDELRRVGHRGRTEFHDGDSHETLKAFFRQNPGAAFDLVTVDGDHSYEGASEDLRDVLPHLKIGGAVVFDDLVHPKHAYLKEVWREVVADDPRFSAWSYEGAGFGVGFALRRW